MRKSWKERNKYMRKNERNANDNIRRIITPSILGIMICMVCLAGTTWAWFTATQDATVATSQVASFNVEVAIEGQNLSNGNNVIIGNDKRTYSIEKNTKIQVTLKSVGDANSGYCKVEVDDSIYHTPCINKKGSYSFTVCAKDGIITISPSWKEINTGISIDTVDNKTIGLGTAQTKKDENKGNSDSHDTAKKAPVIKEADDTKAPAQDGSNDDSTPAQEIKPEQDNSETQGESEEKNDDQNP